MHFPRASANFASFEEYLVRLADRGARIDSNGLYCSSDQRSPGVLQRTLEPHHRWDGGPHVDSKRQPADGTSA
jgi:hypothetical protein